MRSEFPLEKAAPLSHTGGIMFESLTLPLLLKAAPVLIPVAAKLAKHLFDTDNKLLNDLIELAIEKAEDKAKVQLEAALKQKPDVVLAWHRHVFIDYTGWVLGQLVQHLSQQPQFNAEKKELEQLAEQAPEGWKTFVLEGSPGLSPVHQDAFLRQMASSLSRGEELPPIDTVPFLTFFNWHVRLSPALQKRLAEHLRTHLDNAIQLFLVSDYPKANQAYKQIILDGINGLHASLNSLHQKVDVTVPVIVDTNERVQQIQFEQSQLLGPLVEMMKGKTKEERLGQYNRALLAAFKPYQELAIDNFAAAEQTSPDIWDIFVHPTCAEEHLRPEEMDAAQRETPPRNPAVELLPLLAQDDHRRTVLLGDPGMGKSTLIQALIAHLASGRGLAGAPALTGLLPVPLILRDLVPLLPQEKVESWSWDALLDAFLGHYQRDEAAPKLCDAFKDHLPEFRQHLHTYPKVFFLIDGLDEIGDLAKRQKIVECIQDGMKSTDKEARWLVTSRVIGYDAAPVDLVKTGVTSMMSPELWTGKRLRAVCAQTLHKIDDFSRLWGEWLLPDAEKGLNGWSQRISEKIEDELDGPNYDRVRPRRISLRSFKFGELFSLPIAKRLYLAPFDDRRQDAFTQRWFQHRHSTDYSKELMREVRAHHHDGVRIISRVPNLLCLMNILKRSGKPLPDGRAALYDEIVKAYLGGIDAAYRLRPVLGNTCPFDAAQRRFLLALLGAHMQQQRVSCGEEPRAKSKESETGKREESEGAILISKGEIATLLVPVIERLVAERRVQSDHTAQELLDELLHHITSRSGLLIPRSSDEHGETLFGFTHLSFMEFFAAEWLGMEFDRRQRQLARHSEALLEDVQLSPEELEQIFPPAGPIQHARESFKHLPAVPAWHEPLIFLLETRKADAPTLLRWLFPRLHATTAPLETSNLKPETPLLPLDAVRLLVKLTADPEIPIPAEKRQDWWQRLWSAYLDWPHVPWSSGEKPGWPIAPLLLGPAVDRAESLRLLGAAFNQQRGLPGGSPVPPLYLWECRHLTSADLLHLAALKGLTQLDLTGCTGLSSLEGLPPLPQLETLELVWCNGVEGHGGLAALAGCPALKRLSLSNCLGLRSLEGLPPLPQLETLDLAFCGRLEGRGGLAALAGCLALKSLTLLYCIGLRSLECLPPLPQLESLNLECCWGLEGHDGLVALAGCPALKRLDIRRCTGLAKDAVEAFREAWRAQRGTDAPLPEIYL